MAAIFLSVTFDVPHTEADLSFVNGESADSGRLLQDGDAVAVYPRFEALDINVQFGHCGP